MDCAFDEMIDDVSEVEGCAGASRLVCKTDWDYKFILKFDDIESLQNYMKNDHERIMSVHMPNIKALALDGKVHEQNFVCTCFATAHAFATLLITTRPAAHRWSFAVAVCCWQMTTSNRLRNLCAAERRRLLAVAPRHWLPACP